MVVATSTINGDRKKVVSFAGPYCHARQSILTLTANNDIQGPNDLAGTKVCTVSGSTPEANLLENSPNTEVVPFGAYSDCLVANLSLTRLAVWLQGRSTRTSGRVTADPTVTVPIALSHGDRP